MNELITCPTCKTNYETQPEKCNNCGYPFLGTDKEKSHFVAHQILKKGEISNTKDSIKKSRTILFVIAGFNIIVPFFRFNNHEYAGFMIGVSIFIGLIFLLFGFLAKKKPFISILIPLILLVSFYFIDALIEPATLIRGIIWKILFISGLVYSLISIKKSDRIRAESTFLASKDYK